MKAWEAVVRSGDTLRMPRARVGAADALQLRSGTRWGVSPNFEFSIPQ